MARRERDSQKMRHITRSRVQVVNQRGQDAQTENSPLLSLQEDTTSIASGSNIYRSNSRFTNSCKASCTRRAIPKGKGLFLVFIIYFMESFAFYIAFKGIRELLFTNEKKEVGGSFVYSLVVDSLGRLFYPFAGILADSFLGRHKVIEIGLWLIWWGLGLLCLALSIIDFDIVPDGVSRIFLPILCIILISIGSGSVEVNTVSFGVDQLPQGCPSEQISSYFFWYYFTRNAGLLLGVGLCIALFVSHAFFPQDIIHWAHLTDLHFKTLIILVLATVVITGSLFLHICQHHWYFKNSRRDNPIKSILNVTWFSLTVKRHPPVHRRAFRYGEARQPRIELAKIDYDGIFEAEEVENVKTFYQILLLIFSLGGFFASYGAANSMLTSQFEDKMEKKLSEAYQILAPYLSALVNNLTIVIFLPIANHLILPFLPGFNTSLKMRLGVGLVLNLLAPVIAAFLQGTVEVDEDDVGSDKLLWLLLPTIFLALGETVTFVTGLEFIYAQAPEPMKGLLTGLFYFTFGIFVAASDVFFYFFPTQIDSYVVWFYVMFVGVALMGVVAYTIVACLYRNRQRPSEDEDDLVQRMYAQNVFS